MSTTLQVALAFASVGILLTMIVLVRLAARHANLNAEVQRKLVHVGTGLYAMILPWLFPARWPVYMLIGITLLVMVGLRIPRISGGLGSTLHSVERRSYGDFLLALSVGLCFFLAEGVTLHYILPIAVLTLADAAAALAGTAYGTRRFAVEDGEKSIEGTVVFFVVTLLICLISFMFLSDLPPSNILALALMVAAFGTLVEAQSWRGFDNLFLPLGLLVFLAAHSQSSLLDLISLSGVFLFAVVTFQLIGPRFGLSTHAARVYVIAMFLILAVLDVQNTILPGLALAAHAWAHIRNPGSDNYGALDIVAALALFSFGWLTLGNATGWNAVQFYGLTAMGLTMGLSTLALKQRLMWVPFIALFFFTMRFGITTFNPENTLWAEPLWPLACLCLVVSAGATIILPEAFAKNRVMKLTFLSMLLPLGYYTLSVIKQGGVIPITGPML